MSFEAQREISCSTNIHRWDWFFKSHSCAPFTIKWDGWMPFKPAICRQQQKTAVMKLTEGSDLFSSIVNEVFGISINALLKIYYAGKLKKFLICHSFCLQVFSPLFSDKLKDHEKLKKTF